MYFSYASLSINYLLPLFQLFSQSGMKTCQYSIFKTTIMRMLVTFVMAKLAYTLIYLYLDYSCKCCGEQGGRKQYLREGDSRGLCLDYLPLIFCLGNYTWNWGAKNTSSHTLQFLYRPLMWMHTVYTRTCNDTLYKTHVRANTLVWT